MAVARREPWKGKSKASPCPGLCQVWEGQRPGAGGREGLGDSPFGTGLRPWKEAGERCLVKSMKSSGSTPMPARAGEGQGCECCLSLTLPQGG